jgi:hypothetical protein
MAKGGASEARGIAAISALVGKQHKKTIKVASKSVVKAKGKKEKPASKVESKEDKPKVAVKDEPKARPKSGPKAKQQELNFNPPRKKSETPRKRPAAKSASGDNPTHARDADSGKLIKLSPEHKENIKAYNDKKASYAPPKLKPVNLE